MGRCGDCRWFSDNFCFWWLQPREVKTRRTTCFVPLDSNPLYPLYPTPYEDNPRRFHYPEVHGHCLLCGKELTGRKQKYCSSGHRKMYYARFTWANVRFHLWQRDQKCNHCGISLSFEESECDHIIAVALGGAYWDYSNLQTLCLKCHRIKTQKDRLKLNSMKNKHEKSKISDFKARKGKNTPQTSAKKSPHRKKMKYILRGRSRRK